jgi:hypothetical protein
MLKCLWHEILVYDFFHFSDTFWSADYRGNIYFLITMRENAFIWVQTLEFLTKIFQETGTERDVTR